MGVASGQAPATQIVRGRIPAEGTAGTPGVYPICTAPFTGSITRASIIPDTTITGAATNHKRTAVQNRGAAGSGTTEAAGRAHDTGVNAPQADQTDLTLHATLANRDFVQGDVLAVVTTVVGTGIVLPAMSVELELTKD